MHGEVHMSLLWDWMGSGHCEFQWNGSVGIALGFHGLPLVLLFGNSMEVLYG